MSLEKELAANTAAMVNLTAALQGQSPSVTTLQPGASKPKEEYVATEKDDLNPEPDAKTQKKAKALLTQVLKDCGEVTVKEILSHAGAKKFSEVDKTVPVYEDFIERCEKALKETTEADDLIDGDDELDNAPEAVEEALTMDDVKPLVLKVANHPELGKDSAYKILKKLGIEKLSQTPDDKLAAVKAEAEKMLVSVK